MPECVFVVFEEGSDQLDPLLGIVDARLQLRE